MSWSGQSQSVSTRIATRTSRSLWIASGSARLARDRCRRSWLRAAASSSRSLSVSLRSQSRARARMGFLTRRCSPTASPSSSASGRSGGAATTRTTSSTPSSLRAACSPASLCLLPRGPRARAAAAAAARAARAQHARQQALNQLKAAIVTLDPPLRPRLEQRQPATLARSTLLQPPQPHRCADSPSGSSCSSASSADIDRELHQLTRALCPQLLSPARHRPPLRRPTPRLHRHPQRIPSEPAFAALAGVSPIEASSGPTNATASTAAATANSTGRYT